MSKTYFIYSTLANDQIYRGYKPQAALNAPLQPARDLVIKGGARVVPHKFLSAKPVIMTPVDEDQYEFLQTFDVFRRQVERGFYTVTERKADEDKVVVDMVERDNSAPKEPQDYENSDVKPATAETKNKMKGKV